MKQVLYELPVGWNWNDLGAIADFKNGFAFKSKDFSPSGIPLLRISNIQSGGISFKRTAYIPEHFLDDKISKCFVEKGDVVIAMSGATTGKVAVNNSGQRLLQNQRVGRFVIPNKTLRRYVYLFLSANVSENLQISLGAAQPNLSTAQIKGIKIPLPPLNEQKYIVAKLDAIITRIDTAITYLQETLELSKALFASALDESFVPTGDIERPPKTWTCEFLATVSNLVTDGTHHSPKKQYDSEKEGLFKYVTSKNIKFYGMKLDEITYIPKAVHDEIYARCNPEYLDQLITKDGAMTGTCCLNTLDEPYSLLSSVALVKLKRELMLPHFLNYFLQSPTGQELMIGDISGAAITRTNLKKLKAIKVPLPPMEEQKHIVAHLDDLAERTRTLETTTKEKLADLSTLKASLLDAAFMGQL